MDGRVSVAGLNSKNCDYFVEAVDSVVRKYPETEK